MTRSLAKNVLRPAARVILAILLALGWSRTYARQPAAWRWHEPNTEIRGLVFAPDGNTLALVKKVHIPVGHEVEWIPEPKLARLERKVNREPRFADPKVVTLGFRQKVPAVVDWGWTPAFSPDGAHLAYAAQKLPIAGLRESAETLAGNEIRVSDVKTGRRRTVASPTWGYLEAPAFSPDGRQVAYLLCGPVNGRRGGGVGVGRVWVNGAAAPEILYPPSTTLGMHHRLLPPLQFAGERLLGIRAVPVGSFDVGAEVARSYRVDLVDFSRENAVGYSWGARSALKLEPAQVLAPGGDRILVRDRDWVLLAPLESAPFAKKAVVRSSGVLSPDGRLAAEVHGSVFSIRDVKTNRPKRDLRIRGDIREVAWSRDGRRLVAVVTRYKDAARGVFDYDELVGVELD
jgi:hypothetical protein